MEGVKVESQYDTQEPAQVLSIGCNIIEKIGWRKDFIKFSDRLLERFFVICRIEH